jgi:hypothetical protein
MRRILGFSLVGAALAAAALAQETAAPPILAPAAPASAVAPSAEKPALALAVPAPDRTADKPQSTDLSAMLSATRPQYAPPPPAAPKPEEEMADARDIDKPKNRIIRLPKYVVRAEKPPIFREKDIYTSDGIARLALLRYGGLNILPGTSALNAGVATEMYREDERLKNMSSLEDEAASMQRGGDKDEAKFIREASQSTYQQSLDWGSVGVPQNPSAYGANGLR